MKKFFSAALAAALLAASGVSSLGADRWDMAYIGQMKVPAHVTFTEGEQQALPFIKDGGPHWFFTKKAMLDGHFYSMTYADGPDFSYGWAASLSLGSQFLQEQGDFDYRGKTPAEQMDRIAGFVNEDIIRMGASYEGETPLRRMDDKAHPRWEGRFTVTKKERGVTYRETYQAVIQVSGFRVVMGLINSDGDQKALTDSLARMMEGRRFYKDKDLLLDMLRKEEVRK